MKNMFKQLSNQQLIQFIERGGGLVDIRRPEEWRQTGVIADSQLLTFFAQDGGSDLLRWQQQLSQLVPPEQPLALVCRSGYRTGVAAEALLAAGVRAEIYHLSDGILGWLAEKLPVIPVASE